MPHEPHDPHETIERVVIDVLEQMAFIFADPTDPADLPEQLDGALRVTMRFHGFAEGLLSVTTGPGVCAELADGLAEDPDAGQEALKELVNVICGQLLTAVAGDQPVFDLDPPLLTEATAEDWAAARGNTAAVTLMTDDCPVVVQLDYPQAAQAA